MHGAKHNKDILRAYEEIKMKSYFVLRVTSGKCSYLKGKKREKLPVSAGRCGHSSGFYESGGWFYTETAEINATSAVEAMSDCYYVFTLVA